MHEAQRLNARKASLWLNLGWLIKMEADPAEKTGPRFATPDATMEKAWSGRPCVRQERLNLAERRWGCATYTMAMPENRKQLDEKKEQETAAYNRKKPGGCANTCHRQASALTPPLHLARTT